MTLIMTLDDLEKHLLEDGWSISVPAGDDGDTLWLAAKAMEGLHDCYSKKGQPDLWIEAHRSDFGKTCHEWVHFRLHGAIEPGDWINLEQCGVPPGKVLPRMPRIRAVLAAAWDAAHGERSGVT